MNHSSPILAESFDYFLRQPSASTRDHTTPAPSVARRGGSTSLRELPQFHLLHHALTLDKHSNELGPSLIHRKPLTMRVS